jgi:hypothetical protein
MAATATADQAYRIVSTAVDQAFYRAINPELARPGFDPVRHYLEQGWREGRDPAPWFSVSRYLEAHPDLVATGEEPLAQYLLRGAREGRAIFPSQHGAAFLRSGGKAWTFTPPTPARAPRTPLVPVEPEAGPLFDEGERAVVAPEFDARFYLQAYPDLAATNCDPLEHFLAHGWREGRDPAAWFSVREYLNDNPDIARAGINPFAHYIGTGRAEGRPPRATLGYRYKIIAGLTALEDRVADAATWARKAPPQPAADFAQVVERSRTGLKDLHVTFSHDDYAANVGGVQLCLQYESLNVAERGQDHLHLCSATPWPVLRRGESAALSVVLNGKAIGAFTAETIAEGLAAARGSGRGRSSFAIHNLLGHQVDEVIAILGAAGLEAGFFWLHDFTSLCAGYQLLRNDVQDCGAPAPDSAACGVCLYGPARMPQVAEYEKLFRKLRLTVVSPSQVTLDFWRASWSYPTAAEVVLPHVRLKRSRRAAQAEPGPLRLAFLGMPSAHKGWPIFAELAADYAADPRYQFLHLGARRDPRAAVQFHPVSVSLDDPRAMQDALERLEVDVAVIWSIFRETFCFAAYEAVAAGAAIVTGPDSANVAAFVQSSGHGRVLADEAALAQALASGELLGLARSVRKPALFDLEFSGMTAELLATGVAA